MRRGDRGIAREPDAHLVQRDTGLIALAELAEGRAETGQRIGCDRAGGVGTEARQIGARGLAGIAHVVERLTAAKARLRRQRAAGIRLVEAREEVRRRLVVTALQRLAGGLEVGVGNIYGALEWMAGQYPIDLGLTGLGYEYTAYQFGGAAYDSDEGGSAGFNGVEAIYTVGGLNIHASYDEFDFDGAVAGADGSRTALAVAYTFGDWTVAVAAQDSDNATDTEWTATVGGSLGPVALTLAYADNGDNGDYYVLAGLIDVGAATSIEAYVADGDTLDDTSYGLGANYDLGGGTSLQGGFASLGSGQTIADLGVRFNF